MVVSKLPQSQPPQQTAEADGDLRTKYVAEADTERERERALDQKFQLKIVRGERSNFAIFQFGTTTQQQSQIKPNFRLKYGLKQNFGNERDE